MYAKLYIYKAIPYHYYKHRYIVLKYIKIVKNNGDIVC